MNTKTLRLIVTIAILVLTITSFSLADEPTPQELFHMSIDRYGTGTLSGTTHNSGVRVDAPPGAVSVDNDGTINCNSPCTIDGTRYSAIIGYRKMGNKFAVDQWGTGSGALSNLMGCTSSAGLISCSRVGTVQLFYAGKNVFINNAINLRFTSDGIRFDEAEAVRIDGLSLGRTTDFFFDTITVTAGHISEATHGQTRFIDSNNFRFNTNTHKFETGQTELITVGTENRFHAVRSSNFVATSNGKIELGSKFRGSAESREWKLDGNEVILGSNGLLTVGETIPPPITTQPVANTEPKPVDEDEVDKQTADLQALYWDSVESGISPEDFLDLLPNDPALLQAIRNKLSAEDELIMAIDRKIREIANAQSNTQPTPNPTQPSTSNPTDTSGDDNALTVTTDDIDDGKEPISPVSEVSPTTDPDPISGEPPIVDNGAQSNQPTKKPGPTTTVEFTDATSTLSTTDFQGLPETLTTAATTDPTTVAYNNLGIQEIIFAAGNPNGNYEILFPPIRFSPGIITGEYSLNIIKDPTIPIDIPPTTTNWGRFVLTDLQHTFTLQGPFTLEVPHGSSAIISAGQNNRVTGDLYNTLDQSGFYISQVRFNRMDNPQYSHQDKITAAISKNIFGNIFKTESGDENIVNDNTVLFSSGPFENLEHIDDSFKLTNYFRFKEEFYFPYTIKKISDNIEINRNGFLKRTNARNTFTMYAIDTPSQKLFMKRYNDWILETNQDFERIAMSASEVNN